MQNSKNQILEQEIKQGQWLIYEDQLMNWYRQFQEFFSDIFYIPIEKVFYIGYQEFLQKWLLEKDKLQSNQKLQERLTPPFVTMNLNNFEQDRSKVNIEWNTTGLKQQDIGDYVLYVQKSYITQDLNINIFLETRGQLLNYLTFMLGSFDVPQKILKIRSSFDKYIPIDQKFVGPLILGDSVTIISQSITDQSDYSFNTNTRVLRLQQGFRVEGYMTTKFQWSPKIKKISYKIRVEEQTYDDIVIDEQDLIRK